MTTPAAAVAPLFVPATVPPTPLMLVDGQFLQVLAFHEARAKTLEIHSPEAAQQAANSLRELTDAGRTLEAARVELKAPFLVIERAIDAAAKGPAGRIDTVKRTIQKHLTNWADLQAARAREEEQRRQAELRRLEEEKRRHDEEAAKRAAELAAAQTDMDFDIDFADAEPAPKTEIEKKIEAVKFAPAVVPAAPTGVRFVRRLLVRVVDVAKLPEQYVIRTANERLLRDEFCTGWKDGDTIPSVPGCTFLMESTAASTGKSPDLF